MFINHVTRKWQMKNFCIVFCLFICGCQTAIQKDAIPVPCYIEQEISEYEASQFDIYSEYQRTNDSAVKERNQYILSELWKENLLDNQIKSEITNNKYKLVLLQVYGNYRVPNFVVRCTQEFPFPSVWTKFTPTLLINDEVVWAPDKPQKEHSMVINNSTITSRTGGVVKNGDVVQYKVLLQQFQGEELLWQTNLYTNKVVAQGINKGSRK